MNIIVCVRQVPDLVEELEINGEGTALNRDFIKFTVNEFDDWALEQALLLKEQYGATITVIGLESQEIDNTLFTALAKGADEAKKIQGDFSAGVSSHATARLLAEVIRGLPHDLILTGVQSSEDLDGQIGVLLATYLNLPHVSVVTGVDLDGNHALVKKEYAGGVLAEFEVDLPAVLGIQAAKQAPRYAPVSRVRTIMKEKKIEGIGASDVPMGSGLQVRRLYKPESSSRAEMIEGDLDEMVDKVMVVLKDKGIIK